jgi:LPS export ABC transporter protein LptC
MIKRFVFLLLPILVLFSCENSISDINKLNSKNDFIDKIIKGEIYQSTAGVVKLRITGDTILYYTHNNYYIFPSGIKIESLDTSLKVVSTLTADSAIYFGFDEVAMFYKNVVAINQLRADTLYAEDLRISTLSDSISTKNKVHLITKEQNIFGSGMYSKINLKNATVFDSRGFFLIPDSSNNDIH